VLGYRIAVPVTIDGGAEGRYLAYSDPVTGATLAVRQMNLFASGTCCITASIAIRRGRGSDRPAPLAHVMLDGAPQTTSASGLVSWGDNTSQTVATSVVGDLVVIVNKASGGMLSTAQLTLSAGGQVIWDRPPSSRTMPRCRPT